MFQPCAMVSHLKATTFEQIFLVLQNNIYLIFFLLKTLLFMNRTKPPEHFHSYIVTWEVLPGSSRNLACPAMCNAHFVIGNDKNG